jgi:hypothetical protein
MVTGEPTFAGVTLSQFMQLPKGVTVTLAGAGGQAPIISLTDPAALLPTSLQTPPPTQPTGTTTRNLSLANPPGGDIFTNANPLGTNAPLQLNTQAGNAQGEDGPGPGPGKGKGKGKGKPAGGPPGLMKKGGMPPGLAKKQSEGKPLPPGNPWSQSLQTPMSTTGAPPQPKTLLAQPAGIQPAGIQSTPLVQPKTLNIPDPAESPSSIPGLPRPTLGLSPEPGAIVQLGPPLV